MSVRPTRDSSSVSRKSQSELIKELAKQRRERSERERQRNALDEGRNSAASSAGITCQNAPGDLGRTPLASLHEDCSHQQGPQGPHERLAQADSTQENRDVLAQPGGNAARHASKPLQRISKAANCYQPADSLVTAFAQLDFNVSDEHRFVDKESKNSEPVCLKTYLNDAGLVFGENGEFRLSRPISSMLYPHQVRCHAAHALQLIDLLQASSLSITEQQFCSLIQVAGVEWLWKLHTMPSGGILGDDMGLVLFTVVFQPIPEPSQT